MAPQSSPERNCILVVEDHPVYLSGVVSLLEIHFPTMEILRAGSVQEARRQLTLGPPALIVFDLSIPELPAMPETLGNQQEAQPEIGIQLLKQIMRDNPEQNLAIQSTYTRALTRLWPFIDEHRGGFTVIEKTRSSKEALERMDSALKGYSNTKEIRRLQPGAEVKPEWLEVLQLAFIENLQDRTIAEQMNVQQGTVRHYWRKLYDVLEIDPEIERRAGRNLRMLTESRAREKGLID